MNVNIPEKFSDDMSWMPEMVCDMSASKEEMMRQIMEYNFAALDLHLYLDTHPYDQRAIYLFNNCCETGKRLMQAYEMTYGPIVASSSGISVPFKWVIGPWPWE